MKKILIAPSTDPCAIKDLTKYVQDLEHDGADWIHCDIMDGKFVPKRTYDHLILAFLRKATKIPLDVHLMVQNPMDVVSQYVRYGADIITIHYECFNDKLELLNAIQNIKKMNVQVGVSIKPGTPVEMLDNLLPYLDVVLVMSVEPGKSGQQFIKDSLIKIAYLNKKRMEQKYNFLIEVDGGINPTNSSIVTVSGADVLVSGSAVFNASDRTKIMNIMRGKTNM